MLCGPWSKKWHHSPFCRLEKGKCVSVVVVGGGVILTLSLEKLEGVSQEGKREKDITDPDNIMSIKLS